MGLTTGARARRVSEHNEAMAQDMVRVFAIGGRSGSRAGPTRSPHGVQLLAYDEFIGMQDVGKVDMILSPMVAEDFDCLDVAQHLFAQGYSGRYRVMAPNLPNPGMIRHEVRSLCPGLDFDIVTEDGLPARRMPT
jgi:hypothetical protein